MHHDPLSFCIGNLWPVCWLGGLSYIISSPLHASVFEILVSPTIWHCFSATCWPIPFYSTFLCPASGSCFCAPTPPPLGNSAPDMRSCANLPLLLLATLQVLACRSRGPPLLLQQHSSSSSSSFSFTCSWPLCACSSIAASPAIVSASSLPIRQHRHIAGAHSPSG